MAPDTLSRRKALRFWGWGYEDDELTSDEETAIRVSSASLSSSGLKGVDALEPGTPVTRSDLEAWEKKTGIEIRPFTVLGVVPEEFHGTIGILEVDGYLPLDGMELIDPSFREVLEDRGNDIFRVIARLQPGVSLSAARAAVKVQAGRQASEYPEANKNSLEEEVTRLFLLKLFGA